jgi:hypothetical protein
MLIPTLVIQLHKAHTVLRKLFLQANNSQRKVPEPNNQSHTTLQYHPVPLIHPLFQEQQSACDMPFHIAEFLLQSQDRQNFFNLHFIQLRNLYQASCDVASCQSRQGSCKYKIGFSPLLN